MLTFDHIAIAATTLEEGVAFVEDALGLKLAGGGQHVLMGTHNRVMGMGDLYLEVIAVDPSLPRPAHPRWFDMDRFAGPPRITNWIARSDDLAAEVAASPPGAGQPMTFTRGDYHWQMAVPADGILPFDSAYPAMIQWHGTAHPAKVLPDVGLRLERLEIGHPEAAALSAALMGRLNDPRVVFVPAPAKAMRACFQTPTGLRWL